MDPRETSKDIERLDLRLFIIPRNKATIPEDHKPHETHPDPSLLSKTRADNTISPPKLLLASTVFHGLVKSGNLIPAAPDLEDDAASFLKWAKPKSRRLNFPDRGAYYIGYPLVLYGLYKAYDGWNLHDPKFVVLCVYGALVSIWTTFLLVDNVVIWAGTLIEIFLEKYRHGIKIRGLLDNFATDLGVKVCHLDFWNDTGGSEIPDLKRSLPAEGNDLLPVFEASTHGYDFHFTYRGEIDGNALIRFGFSVNDGLDNGLNKPHDTPYFKEGGVDFLIQPVSSLEGGSWNGDDERLDWLYDQINGLLSETTPWEGSDGIWFQLYDRNKRITVAIVAMAPFGESGKSAISAMKDDMRSGFSISRTGMEDEKFEVYCSESLCKHSREGGRRTSKLLPFLLVFPHSQDF
ncbi:hypothetical protein BCR34DRAFT_321369 [Clohesyomyces aquaticus]|uniref:Uncharacterized protein n=1 Tax=Clohesyomyces aquaticus TaxID=1231657 RepID=A0A1Y2A7V3_9PLEO|nr:hypothetical protein BCR34DRAFT_321369 [Clohesyomyces aquaticus]